MPIGHVWTPATTTISVHHTCEDHDEDTVHLENHEMLANTVEWRSTVFVQEDFDDTNSASSDSLSPDLGEVWRSVLVPGNISEEEGSKEYHEHNVWNSMLDVLCHF